jgi:opacity protein-like surface antigen
VRTSFARALALVVVAWAASSPAWAAEAPAATRPPAGAVRLSLRGGFVPGSPTFTDTVTFTDFVEEGRIDSRYAQDPGPGLEAELAWRFARRFAVSAAAAYVSRTEGGSFSAALPHPFLYGAPRHAEGDFGGRSTRETSLHLDLAVVGGSGRLEWRAFAGPSLIAIEADLVRSVEFTHVYPFDAVTVTGTPFASVRGNAVGFNLGAGLDWQLARHVAIGTQGRFSRATVGLDRTAGERVKVEGGGVHLAAGVRLDF